MKKAKTAIFFVLGVALGALSAIGIYFLTVGDVAWQEYVQNDLIPNAVLAMSTAGTLCIAALPIIAKVQNAVTGFNQATKDVNDTVQNDKALTQTVGEYRNELNTALAEIRELKNDMKKSSTDLKREMNVTIETFKGDVQKTIGTVEKTADNIEKVCRLGFCNNEELVRKGYAHEIEKVGAEDGK